MLTTLKKLLTLTDPTPLALGSLESRTATPSTAWWMWLSSMSDTPCSSGLPDARALQRR